MIVLVLGMHRSGTSALTRTLTLMGATVPGTLMQPAPGENELGFWESVEIMESHDRFLTAVGSSWDDMRPLPEAVFEGAPARSCRDELSVLIERARTGQPLLVVKDPRLCRLLPLWLRLLADIGEENCAVLPIRNPLEVAHSLLARNQIERERGLMLWLMHALVAERQSRAMRRAIVSYADCLAAPRGMAEGLARSLGCFDEERVREALPQIEAFWRRDLRHHTRDEADMLADPATPGWIRDAYHALLQYPLPLDDLDHLNREVARALEGVGRYLIPPPPDRSVEVAELAARISELDADRARLVSDREAMRSRHEELLTRRDEDIAARDGEIGRLTGELTESRTLTEGQERRLAEKEAIQSRQTAIIEAQNKELSREGERIAAALATIKDQTRLLIEKEAALAHQIGLTEAKDKEIGRIAREAKRLGSLVLRQERELAVEQNRGAALAEDLQSARNDLAGRDRTLAALRDEIATLLRQLDDEQRAVALLRQEQERVSSSIRELEAWLDRQRTHLAVLSFMPRGRRG